MMALWVVLVSMLAGVAVAAEPAVLTGKVVSVHDGDTLRVLDAAGTQHVVRLQGIDAPETKQAFGTKARNRLADLTLSKAVSVRVHGRDKYGRTLGTVEVAGQDVNRRMVADGMAWHYARFDKSPALAGAERDARAARRGLWAEGNAVRRGSGGRARRTARPCRRGGRPGWPFLVTPARATGKSGFGRTITGPFMRAPFAPRFLPSGLHAGHFARDVRGCRIWAVDVISVLGNAVF